MYARPFIDSLEFARNGSEISGGIPVAEMPRLLDALENTRGSVSYTVRGGVDDQNIPFLDVSVAGQCQLRCQRCLGALDYPIQVDTRLLLRDQAGMDALGDAASDEDEFDSILADAQLDVLNQLEEEILLSLPIAPRHEPGVCQVADGIGAQNGERNPFAVLAKLKVVK
ncbi:MAG TPA: YceD family protein [Gallionella sp.]